MSFMRRPFSYDIKTFWGMRTDTRGKCICAQSYQAPKDGGIIVKEQ